MWKFGNGNANWLIHVSVFGERKTAERNDGKSNP